MKDVLTVVKKKPRCPKCGKKLGRADRLKLKMMNKWINFQEFSEEAKQDFKEVEGCCSKCIMKFLGPKFKEKSKQLGDKVIPDEFKKILDKAKKVKW